MAKVYECSLQSPDMQVHEYRHRLRNYIDVKLGILFPRFRCLTPRATKNFSGKYTRSNFNTNVLRKPGFLDKNCFFKEMGPLIFLSRVKFSGETVSDLFYLLKIDDLTF